MANTRHHVFGNFIVVDSLFKLRGIVTLRSINQQRKRVRRSSLVISPPEKTTNSRNNYNKRDQSRENPQHAQPAPRLAATRALASKIPFAATKRLRPRERESA